jgi:hypothetical protein
MRSLLKEDKEVNPLTPESWMRASAMAELCPREEVLCNLHQIKRRNEVSPDLSIIFEHGKALHSQLQNSLLPSLGVLWGQWSCLHCGLNVGVKPDLPTGREPVAKWAVPRPSSCAGCSKRRFLYEESYFESSDYRIRAHPDGFLKMTGFDGLGILEAKSISQRGAWEVRNAPNINHVIQAHVYMWLSDLQWGKILYWDKGGQGLGSIIEHTVERDEETVTRIKETLSSLWAALKTKELPGRICMDAGAPRAKTCPAGKPCFSEP